MLDRFVLIFLVLVHALTLPAMRAGAEGLPSLLPSALCAPQNACVTDDGCCCIASPVDDLPEPEPVSAPARGTELIPLGGVVSAPISVVTGVVSCLPSSARPIDPEAQLRRLSRMCVWRT